jgi:hypothetical protein
MERAGKLILLRLGLIDMGQSLPPPRRIGRGTLCLI